MATKRKSTRRKASEPTLVKDVIEAKKGAIKEVPTKKRSKQPNNKPIITYKDFEEWFYKRSEAEFIEITEQWNEANLKIKLQKQANYDQWLNYFKTLPPRAIRLLAKTGLDILPTEAYAALARWHDIISNPGRIDKIHQAGLTNPKGKHNKSIVDLAAKNDRLGVLMATRDKIAEKLEKGAGARDTAALARELTEVMTQIADYEKRLGPKKDTMLGQLMSDMPGIKSKRPSRNGGGARNTSFKSSGTGQIFARVVV